MFINSRQTLYFVVGGSGNYNNPSGNNIGGYNGGGTGKYHGGGGGGATHIALSTGDLKDISNKENIITVAGGGGGGAYTNVTNSSAGGSGGGCVGGNANINAATDTLAVNGYGTGGSQISGGSASADFSSSLGGKSEGTFGVGANSKLNNSSYGSGGGGGGYYGGGASTIAGAGGGSGNIANSLLTDKYMYCYNCETSDVESTKTYTTKCAEETPTENCAKKGNGYARITFLHS